MDEAPGLVSPVELYESGLHSQRLWAEDTDGERVRLPVSDWSAETVPGDASLLQRCRGATLDIGCGPGRLVAALAAAGLEALGIDISAAAIARASAAGGRALRRSIFGPVPGEGQWHSALLADGNIGIGGDPHALLRRTRELLAPGGCAHVELAQPGALTKATTIRLQDASGRVSHWFPWASVGFDGVADLADACGFVLTERWCSADRWFASLRRG